VSVIKCCLNPKVIGGLAVVAAGVLIISPHAFGRALPLLLGLICPLSMVGMVVMMARGGKTGPPPADDQQAVSARRAEITRLRAEVEQLRQSHAADGGSRSGDRPLV
jgi:hypothetical protein